MRQKLAQDPAALRRFLLLHLFAAHTVLHRAAAGEGGADIRHLEAMLRCSGVECALVAGEPNEPTPEGGAGQGSQRKKKRRRAGELGGSGGAEWRVAGGRGVSSLELLDDVMASAAVSHVEWAENAWH
jgi:hypothetical protein